MIRNFTPRRIRNRMRIWAFILFSAVMATQASAQEMNTLFTAPLDTLTALSTRPLFTPTRHAAPVAIPDMTTPQNLPAQTLDGVLLGIAKSEDGNGLALLRLNNAAEPIKVKLGEVVFGWELSALEDHKAIFVKDGQTVSLTFP